ncbi:MAG: RNA polymerase sigma-54 factor [Hyphomicrobiales bacterium]|nr:MAG: RNA polymerase sigma-54 factor [Hyphomicrobiales bacterium]
MALFPKLELRQGQSLVMTPQLQQAIKLLQLSNLDLAAYVENELERNPLLDREENQEGVSDQIAENLLSRAADEGGETDAGIDLSDMSALKSMGDNLDSPLDNVFPDDASIAGAGANADAEPPSLSGAGQVGLQSAAPGRPADFDDSGMEETIADQRSLHDHLTEQMQISISDPAQRLIGAFLIDLVDDDGYMRGDLEQLAEQLGAPEALVRQTLSVMQEFDPPGVMARNLTECLAQQLKERNRLDPAIQIVLDNLDLLAKREFARLTRLIGLPREDLDDIISDIRALNPKPGQAFSSALLQPVVPDIFAREGPDGNWIVELNSDTLPRVLVNRQYYASISRSAQDSKDKTYLSECLSNASWLVKSLDQRARTILKTASEIIRQQDAFMNKGVQYLRPLNLKTVAEAVSMHESTISRVTSNKYIATPRGVFELKYFFSSSISAVSGEDAFAGEAVRARIQQLIEAESPDKILSDGKLVDMLRLSGIDIARRTVAKYREAMGISSSVQRRREKKNPF